MYICEWCPGGWGDHKARKLEVDNLDLATFSKQAHLGVLSVSLVIKVWTKIIYI